MNFYFNGAWRMDWGFGNPNKTATLIACLMIALWAIPMIWKRGFWPVLTVCIGLAWCLVQTYSRGGMLAFIVGIGVLLLWVPLPWPKTRWIGVVASLWILGGFVLYAKAQTRYGQGLFSEDQSISHRLLVWRSVPEMMASAAWGWGFGKGGESYTQWFQPFDQTLHYFNLVSSHFTWMVEGGWIVSCLYLFAWSSIFILCWPDKERNLQALPFALWTALFVGACFSHVEESIWLWILPSVVLGYVLFESFRSQQWPSAKAFAVSGTGSVAVVGIIVLVGFTHLSLPITSHEAAVTIGKGSTETFILVDREVMGSFYGHTFRKFLVKNPSLISGHTFELVESTDNLPPSAIACLVVSGRFGQNEKVGSHLNQGQQIVFVNPSGYPDDAKLDTGLAAKTTVYFGEYSQAPSRASWSAYPGIKSVQIDGASQFVPSWPEAILTPPKT